MDTEVLSRKDKPSLYQVNWKGGSPSMTAQITVARIPILSSLAKWKGLVTGAFNAGNKNNITL